MSAVEVRTPSRSNRIASKWARSISTAGAASPGSVAALCCIGVAIRGHCVRKSADWGIVFLLRPVGALSATLTIINPSHHPGHPGVERRMATTTGPFHEGECAVQHAAGEQDA